LSIWWWVAAEEAVISAAAEVLVVFSLGQQRLPIKSTRSLWVQVAQEILIKLVRGQPVVIHLPLDCLLWVAVAVVHTSVGQLVQEAQVVELIVVEAQVLVAQVLLDKDMLEGVVQEQVLGMAPVVVEEQVLLAEMEQLLLQETAARA
jgi:hypothetical protein